jgi:lipoprotein NlpD
LRLAVKVQRFKRNKAGSMKKVVSLSAGRCVLMTVALSCLLACAPTPPKPSAPAPSKPATKPPKTTEVSPFVLPTQGHVIYRFDGKTHKGIGLSGAEGSPVVAAADGVVAYAGSGLRSYGNMIIIKHNEVFLTAYAHNRALLVKEDQRVSQGQKIAEMGNTSSDVTKLHFEIRKNGVAVNPETYLTFPGAKPPRAKAP